MNEIQKANAAALRKGWKREAYQVSAFDDESAGGKERDKIIMQWVDGFHALLSKPLPDSKRKAIFFMWKKKLKSYPARIIDAACTLLLDTETYNVIPMPGKVEAAVRANPSLFEDLQAARYGPQIPHVVEVKNPDVTAAQLRAMFADGSFERHDAFRLATGETVYGPHWSGRQKKEK